MPSTKKRKAVEREARSKQLRLWGIAGAAVIGIALIAVAVSLGGQGAQPVAGETRPVTVSGGALPAYPGSVGDPAVGMAAPTLTGESFDGTQVTIDPGSTGNPIAIWFMAHWCPHCNQELPRIVALEGQGALPDGVDVYAVSTAVNPGAPNYPPSTWFASAGWPFPVLADDDANSAGEAYNIPGFPYLVLTDSDGNVVARYSGELGDEQIVSALQQLVG
jgi:thiol-disulfide isomerase/thioredoxin